MQRSLLASPQWWRLHLRLVLTLFVVWQLRIGEDFGFFRLYPAIVGAYLVQWFIPAERRPLCFSVFSVAGLFAVLGWQAAAIIIGVGSGFLLACSLPLSNRVRGLVVLGLGLTLAWARTWTLPARSPWELAFPILGAFLMFRMVLFLMHLARGEDKPTLAQSVGYLFMIPQVSFLLFPVISPGQFWKGQLEEYQGSVETGLTWIARGLTHILAYRLIYHFVAPRPQEVVDLQSLVLFMACSYALYVRISGQFHIVVGVLGVLGVRLPPTHDWYLLSTSLTDLWRRINIYWHDFMVKLFYFPVYFKTRGYGTRLATIVSASAVFLGSWILHSYQWFWLRGTFPITVIDAVFWTLFCFLVIVGQVRERKSLGSTKVTLGPWRRAARNGLLSLRTFCLMSVLWSFLSSGTISEWLSILSMGREVSLWGVGSVLGGIAALWLLLSGLHRYEKVLRGSAMRPFQFGGFALLLVIAVSSSQYVRPQLPAQAEQSIAALAKNRLSERDEELMVRGYYENVVALDRYLGQLWKSQLQAPPGWGRPTVTVWKDGEFRWRLPALEDREFKRARLTTNRWGMRDRDYDKEPPSGTWRAALLGASIEMGAGIDDGHNFESIVERELNENADEWGGYRNYEILNFSVAGLDLLRRVHLLEHEVVSFKPRVAIHASAGPKDEQKLVEQLSVTVTRDIKIPYPEIQEMVEQAGIELGMQETEVRRRMKQIGPALTRWSYERFVQVCRDHDIIPVWMFVPVSHSAWKERDGSEHRRWAETAGMVTLSIGDAYEEASPESIILAPWDRHPNAKGHALLADALLSELKTRKSELRMRETDSR